LRGAKKYDFYTCPGGFLYRFYFGTCSKKQINQETAAGGLFFVFFVVFFCEPVRRFAGFYPLPVLLAVLLFFCAFRAFGALLWLFVIVSA